MGRCRVASIGVLAALLGLMGAGVHRLAADQGDDEPELVTDRPDFTESTETVPSGRSQLEVGYTFAREQHSRAHSVGEALLRIGLAERAELRLGLSSYSRIREGDLELAGFEDFSVGCKFKLIDGGPGRSLRPHLAVIAATSVPSGSDDLRADTPQPEVKLAIGWDLSDRLGLAANLNGGWPSEEGERYRQFSGSVSLGLGISERLGGFIEYFGFVPESLGAGDRDFVDGGLTWLVRPNLQLDARAGVALRGVEGHLFGGFGLAQRW